MTENRQIIIDSLPAGKLKLGNYALRTVESSAIRERQRQ